MKKTDKIKRFDFAKKAKNPGPLMYAAKWIISWPDLKKRNYKLVKTNMENVKAPYLMLVTHSSMVDFNLMLKATHPEKVNNVMTLEGFNTYTEPLMRSLFKIYLCFFRRQGIPLTAVHHICLIHWESL